jgi:hypothetical protein
MKIRHLLLLACLVFFPLSASAQGIAQTYVIKKGDTLWGISERFLKDPYYWPNMWSHNPEIGNPHFIYPGQKILIYDGRIEFVPVETEKPAAVAAAAPATAPALAVPAAEEVRPALTVKTLGGAEGFVSSSPLAASGILVDTVDNRIMIGAGDTVFLKMNDPATVAPGDLYSLYARGKLVSHPVTGTVVGHRIIHLGVVRISAIDGQVATGTITESFREIERGAILQPFHPALREIELKRAPEWLSGYLVDAGDGKIALGQYDVIFLDLGRDQGLEVGNLLHISRPREASRLADSSIQGLRLPDVLLGSAVVLETQPGTAAALVLKVVGPLYRGDRVSTVTQ